MPLPSGKLIILPFRVRPQVPDVPDEVTRLPEVPLPGGDYPAPSVAGASRDDVIKLYEIFLGREPENEGAIVGRIGRPIAELIAEFTASDEYRNRFKTTPAPAPTPGPPPQGPPIGLTAWDLDAGQRIADNIAQLRGRPRPANDIALVFAVQAHHEDAGGDPNVSEGARLNNPLNLSDAGGSIHWPGQTGRYLGSFAAFGSLEEGARACALNYNGQYYPDVMAAFDRGDAIGMAAAIQASPWDADHYGGNLVNEVRLVLGR